MDNAYVDGLRQYDNRSRSPVVVPHDMSALRKKILFESTLLEERTLHEFSANSTGGYDAGAINVNPVQSYVVNSDNANLTLPGNADQFNFTINQAVTSFNLEIVGFGTFSLLNNYDANNFANCYLSAYNLNNISITYNPVYVTASETLSSNGQLFTIFYTNTGSVLLSIFKSETIEPAPTPTPTPTPTITPTRTPTPTPTPTPSVTPSGIPVAGTNYVIISGASNNNGTFQKFNTGTSPYDDWILTGTLYKTQSSPMLFSPGAYVEKPGEGNKLGTPYNNWTLVSFYYDGEYNDYIYQVVATNASTDINYIPVNSWSPSLSVLSATQIPVGQAAQLFISFANLEQLRYNKLSNTNWKATNIGGGYSFHLSWNTYTANTWVLTGDNIYNPPGILVATNPSTDSTKIPTINWSYTTGSANVVQISYV